MQRARFLVRHEPFLAEVDGFVAGWNARHPAFAVPEDSAPPPPPRTDAPWQDYVFPPELGLVLEEVRQTFPPSPDHEPAQAAMADWMLGLRDVCELWWPTADFPDWSKDVLFADVTMAHPAMAFVGACALSRAEVPEELVGDPERWIRPFSLDVRELPFDPEDPIGHPSAMRWRLAYRGLVDRLAARLRGEGRTSPLTMEDLQQAERESMVAALDEVASDLRDRTKRYRFLYLPPGLKSTTVNEYMPAIRSTLDHLEAAERGRQSERARQLKDEGASKAEIGRRLGVSTPTVDKLLADSDPART